MCSQSTGKGFTSCDVHVPRGSDLLLMHFEATLGGWRERAGRCQQTGLVMLKLPGAAQFVRSAAATRARIDMST